LAFHHFTVDVEEFFHSTALADFVPSNQWESLPRRAPGLVSWLLDRMDEHDATGTFFVLGWLGQREPALIKEIAARGHELAVHSMRHRRVIDLSPDEFFESVRTCKDSLEQLIGSSVLGYRAPSFSIRPGCEWAFDVLLEAGFIYDSSLFPIAVHPDYGYPQAQLDPYWIPRPNGRLVEVPLLTRSLFGKQLPAAGGAYLRFFPYSLIRSALVGAERRGSPGTTYIHPWDFDPGSMRIPLPRLLGLRIHMGANAARKRLLKLLDGFSFRPVRETVQAMYEAAGAE
jgi:polysaccharide deacetylase family protein (PEP-CTERM system associated)